MDETTDGTEMLAGRFDRQHGSQVFLGTYGDPMLGSAIELHEAVHAELWHMSTHGSLTNIICSCLEEIPTEEEHGEVVRLVAQLLTGAQRVVQEVVATTAGILHLTIEGYFESHALSDAVAPSYLKYLAPYERFRQTAFSVGENVVEGCINLGLAALCSPVDDAVCTFGPPFDIEVLRSQLSHSDLSPYVRLLRILEALEAGGYSVARFNPQQDREVILKALEQARIPIREVASPEEGRRRIARVLGAPLLAGVPGVVERFLEKSEFADGFLDVVDAVRKGAAFLRREAGMTYFESDEFEDAFEFVEEQVPGLRADGITPVLELRAEDIVPDPHSDALVRLPHDIHLCHLFPVQGDDKHVFSSLVSSSSLDGYRERSLESQFLVLLDSAGYDFRCGSWCGRPISEDHFVVLPLGSSGLVDRVLTLYPSRSDVRLGVVRCDAPHLELMIAKLPYRSPQRNCFAVIPSTATLWAFVTDDLETQGVRICSGESFEQEFPTEMLPVIVEHLAGVGWATENVADEKPDSLVP